MVARRLHTAMPFEYITRYPLPSMPIDKAFPEITLPVKLHEHCHAAAAALLRAQLSFLVCVPP